VVFPNREAAKRITPLLISSTLLNYMPVSGKLVIAELEIPGHFWGKTVLEMDLRRKYGLNLISVRRGAEEYGLLPRVSFPRGGHCPCFGDR